MSAQLEEILVDMLAALPQGKSLAPQDVARAAAAEGEDWRRLLPRLRGIVVGLARQDKLVVLRHGKPADPNAFKGVYRLARP
ncbi:MAG: hypothetical protein JWM33_3946 [Caulobacteraceae bacterium]|nr:hypothetical protein [Caulobacteraceae bacterium]